MDESQSYVKQKKKKTRHKKKTYYMIQIIWNPTIGKLNFDIRNQIRVWMEYGVD